MVLSICLLVQLITMLLAFRFMSLSDKYYVLRKNLNYGKVYRGDMFHSNNNKTLSSDWYSLILIPVINNLFLFVILFFYIESYSKYKQKVRENSDEIRNIRIFGIDINSLWNKWTLKKYL